MPIIIDSFQWGQANDKNRGQAWAFWNAKDIDYRKNSQYIELSKRSATQFSVTSIPRAITFWGNQWSIRDDLVVFTSGGIYTYAWQQSVLSGIVNVWEANWEKFILTGDKIYQYTDPSTNTLLATLATTCYTRPTMDWWWDLLIWDGNKLAKWTVTNTLEQYNGTVDLIWNLDGIVVALTHIWPNIYVWCNNGTNTNVYIWDWAWPLWQQKITYHDKAVQNVALLWNLHYWWQSKSHWAIKEVIVWESYSPQVFVKSDYPELTLTANPDNEKNKMALATENDAAVWTGTYFNTNAIETVSDIVFLPWIWRLFTFGRYFPWDKYSFNAEYTFTGTYVYCMASWGYSGSWLDTWWFLAYAVKNGSTHDINLINLGQDNATPSYWYASSWELETMEYIAPNFAKWEDDRKYTIPFELSSWTSIKVYEKRDRWSYSLIKTLTYTDFPWYQVAEISTQGKWRTKQFKFELITTDASVSPKLYVWFTNEALDTWKV